MMTDSFALQRGFRLQVPGTQLWFNVAPDLWAQVRGALEVLGCEAAEDGLAGEQVCQATGMIVSYCEEAGRLRAEIVESADADVVGYLEALLRAVPAPDAEASAVWIWGPKAFTVAGRVAESGRRVMRAARWTKVASDAADVLTAAAAAAGAFGGTLTMHVSVGANCTLDLASASQIRGDNDLARRAAAFGAVIARLGAPDRAEYATLGGEATEG